MKKQGFGMWLSLLAIIAAVVGYVIYGQAIVAGDGLLIASGSEAFYDTNAAYFEKMTTTVVPMTIAGIATLVAAVVLGQFKNKVCTVITSIVRIATPVLFMVALLGFLEGSFTGLGWTFFSNEELEIYAEAIAVGQQVITALIAFAAAMVVSIFASFFAIKKNVKVEA